MDLLQELPFSIEAAEATLSPLEIQELFRDGYSQSKIASDGILGFHSVLFATSNAKEMARYFESVLGFHEIAYRGLETGSSLVGAHVVSNGDIRFEFVNNLENPNNSSAYCAMHNMEEFMEIVPQSFVHECFACQFLSVRTMFTKEGVSQAELARTIQDAATAWEVHRFSSKHGMGVYDVAFEVTDVDEMYQRAIANSAISVMPPNIVQDKCGLVKMAILGVPGHDLKHTLVQNLDYTGCYLPRYRPTVRPDFPSKKVVLHNIDHCVQNFSWNGMMPSATFYAAAFGLHKFWSVDDQDVSTGNTALRLVVMTSANGKVKMPINEPAKSKMRGQIEEFYEYHDGAGVQHIALLTRDIVGTVSELQARGLSFNRISDAYYDNLKARLDSEDIELHEDFNQIRDLFILVDFDPATKFKKKNGKYGCNYILQIFTEPLHDRPTFFIEIIQRHHHNGFGKGTFKGLFESIELQQRMRGTLIPN